MNKTYYRILYCVYDANGNMVSDANRGVSEVRYNSLNLPSRIVFNNVRRIENRYRADGVKLSSEMIMGKIPEDEVTIKSLVPGLITETMAGGDDVVVTPGGAKPIPDKVIDTKTYIGNYEFSGDSLLRLNTPYGYFHQGHYYVNAYDYQGNLVASGGNYACGVAQDNSYYPYGLNIYGLGNNKFTPYLFGGKEFEERQGLNLYDFHARTYVPDIARFMQPDPLATENHGVSPYTYCNGDPINNIDPTGCNPVYNTQGYLIGITDTGLQGEPIIVEDNGTDLVDYRKMTWDEIQSLNLGVDGLVNEEAKSRYEASVAGLPDRPDWDGYITLEEANKWYREGNGEPLYADLQKVDLSGLLSLGEKDVGKSYIVNLFIGSGSLTDALVYGTITLKRYPDHGVRAYDDRYDFDIKKSIKPNVMMRNALTVIGEWIAGSGTPYSIQFYGTAKLNPIFPWTK